MKYKKIRCTRLAAKLGNVSEALRLSGVSRDTIYRHKRLTMEGGIDALRRQETPDLKHKNRPKAKIRKVVID